MGRLALLVLVVAMLAGCNQSSASSRPTATARPKPSPQSYQPKIVLDKAYWLFLRTLCQSFANRDAKAVINSLSYYEYNSGLRYGRIGDGEGQTADPSLMTTWLAQNSVRCQSFTSGAGGHGVLLTHGWTQPGGWALVEVDIFNGKWKINDFTFGDHRSLAQAIHAGGPTLEYHA